MATLSNLADALAANAPQKPDAAAPAPPSSFQDNANAKPPPASLSNLSDALGAKPPQRPTPNPSSHRPAPTKEDATAPTSAQAAGSPVPIVDFGAFSRNGGGDEKGARKRVAKEIDEALRTVGFVYLKNHGVKESMVKEVFEWSHTFFALPAQTKLLAPHPPGGSHHRGYSAPGLEKVSQHTYAADSIASLRAAAPDVKESFECGNEADAAQPNVWLPEDALPGFREGCMRFFGEGTALVHTVLRALGVALKLAAVERDDDDDDDDDNDDASQYTELLSRAHAASAFQLRMLHYPPVSARLLREQAAARIGAHSDFGSLTLLFQDSVGGLEVESPPGGPFRPAPSVEGAVLLNVGDLLERWSNGRWRSTVHRVGLPAKSSLEEEGEGEGERMCEPRYSIPIFASPDPHTVIEALPGCWDEGANPKKYPPVTAAEYVTMRMNALY